MLRRLRGQDRRLNEASYRRVAAGRGSRAQLCEQTEGSLCVVATVVAKVKALLANRCSYERAPSRVLDILPPPVPTQCSLDIDEREAARSEVAPPRLLLPGKAEVSRCQAFVVFILDPQLPEAEVGRGERSLNALERLLRKEVEIVPGVDRAPVVVGQPTEAGQKPEPLDERVARSVECRLHQPADIPPIEPFQGSLPIGSAKRECDRMGQDLPSGAGREGAPEDLDRVTPLPRQFDHFPTRLVFPEWWDVGVAVRVDA